MLGKLRSEEIEELLKTQLVGRIGCHADGQTYIVPISYAYDGNYIYCHTYEGKKTLYMRTNPSICFEVELMNDMANWKTVIIQGNFEELRDTQEKKAAMDALLQRSLPLISSATTHLGKYWPFKPNDIAEIDGILFRIAITEKTGRFESNEASPTITG